MRLDVDPMRAKLRRKNESFAVYSNAKYKCSFKIFKKG